jgi:hypothetical protein
MGCGTHGRTPSRLRALHGPGWRASWGDGRRMCAGGVSRGQQATVIVRSVYPPKSVVQYHLYAEVAE